MGVQLYDRLEKIVGKGEIAHYKLPVDETSKRVSLK